MRVDELNERLKDPNSTFTADEVKFMIDWYSDEVERRALSSERIRIALQDSEQIASESQAQWERLFSQISADTVPNLGRVKR